MKKLYLTESTFSSCSFLPSRFRHLTGLFTLIFILFASNANAEGSKELHQNLGSRAYMSAGNVPSIGIPFPSQGTMFVYVKAGESINVGSSAQGIGNGTINLIAPNGTAYSSGNSATIGKINNRTEEAIGALNGGGYTPYTHVVTFGEEGVWQVNFVAPDASASVEPPVVNALANWTQGVSYWISAWDITVADASNNAINGRAYATSFCGNMGAEGQSFNGAWKVLTKDGYTYDVNNNGIQGYQFQFFTNNKGVRDGFGNATYKSLNSVSLTPNVHDPRLDDTPNDYTNKLFFNEAAADLPITANIAGGGTTWLRNPVGGIVPTISNLSFVGIEGTTGVTGSNPLGGYITFDATLNGAYTIQMDINRNGSYADPIDRTFTGSGSTGFNRIYWNGLDGLNGKVPGGITVPIVIYNTLYTAEVHFPFFDVENCPNGMIISRTNGPNAPNWNAYWDNSDITSTGTAPNPVTTPAGGTLTLLGGQRWSANWGDQKTIDTWAYAASATLTNTTNVLVREADLEVSSLTPNATGLCTGQTVTYTTTVRNNGPTNSSAAKFKVTFPTALTGVTVTNTTTGVVSVLSPTTTATQFTATLNMNNNATVTFTISGTVASVPAGGNMVVNSSVLRTPDNTDPDATVPDAAVPTDAQVECDGGPSGPGCNNIKQSSLVVTQAPTTATAGPDQTMCSVTSATLAGNTATSGTGLWTLVSSTGGTPVITSPAVANTTVTGLTPGDYVFRWSIATGGACPASTDDVTISIQGPISVNTSTAPSPSVFCGTSNPDVILGSTPSGGTGSYVYQWQGSTDNSTFNDIFGATAKDYDPSNLSNTTYFRRRVTSGVCAFGLSNVSTIQILPSITGNTVTAPATTTFCGTGDPANITGPNPGGGSGSYSYQWQSSLDGSTFTDIVGANGLSYDPPSTSGTIYYRRQTTSGVCAAVPTNVITFTVNPALAAGSVAANQTYCGPTDANALTQLTAPTGGNGSYTYRWQLSTTSAVSGFANIPGETNVGYNPPLTSQTSYFRRVVSSAGCTEVNTNVITVTINTGLTGGTVGSDQSFCANGDPAVFTELSPASGGGSAPTYQWQNSIDNVTFSDIAGQNGNVYDPPAITKTTYYRRTATSASCGSTFSNVITVTITSGISANTINTDQTVCLNTTPAKLSGSNPSGGNGTYGYLWESSITDASGFVPAAGTNNQIDYTPASVSQNTIYRRTVTSGACSAALSNVVTVLVSPAPTIANAGADQGPFNSTFVNLNANIPTVGVGNWTKVSGPNNPTIQNNSLSNTAVTGMVPGTYVFRWTISNSPCPPSFDEVTIFINLPPVANPDNATVAEDSQVTFSLVNNDTDADGSVNIATITVVTPPTNGTLQINPDGTVKYTPNPNYNGTDSFTYTILDDLGQVSSPGNVNITITPINDKPVATDDKINTGEDIPVNLSAPGVMSNDMDPDLETLTVTIITSVKNGTVTLNPNGSLQYTPTLDYVGLDSLIYKVCDGAGVCDTATVIIDIGNLNDTPVAKADAYSTVEETDLVVTIPGVISNDTDADGDALAVNLIATTTHGIMTLFADGSFVYRPAANYSGPDQFTYRACDGAGACSTAVVNITVTPINDKPVSGDVNYTTDEDVSLNVTTGGVLSATTDPDGDLLSATVITSTAHGTLTLNVDGTFTYLPTSNFNGVDQFTFKVCDSGTPSMCDTAVAYITINPVNDKPVANTEAISLDEDGSITINSPGVLGNDTDIEGGVLSSSVTTPPAHGTLTLNANGRLVYTPTANYSGPDFFIYQACDDGGLCDTAIVQITVITTNDCPTVNNNNFSVTEDVAFSRAVPGVLNNDTDPDGDVLTTVAVTLPNDGVLVFNTDGSLNYTPNANFFGIDQFNYKACDPAGCCVTATVTFRVNPVNDNANAEPDFYSTDEDNVLTVVAPGVTANDLEPDGDPTTVNVITAPASGALSLNTDGSFIYTPNPNFFGTDFFIYEFCDGKGPCDTARAIITVNPINDLPVIGDVTYTTNEDVPLSVALPGVLINSSDVDGDVLTPTITTNAQHGTVTLNANGSFNYVPAANYNGTDVFVVNVCDPSGACGLATITINVVPLNDIPVAVNDTYTTNEDITLTIANPGVLGNDSDGDGDAMSVSVLTTTKHGSFTLNSAGGFTFIPDPDYNGLDSATYQVCDAFSACATAKIKITVVPINDAPRAVADNYIINEDEVLNRTAPGILFNDLDPEGTTLTATLFSAPGHGTATVNPDGSFTYIPTANYNGNDFFVYKVCDAGSPSLCSNQVVNIIINPLNDAPDAVINAYTLAEDAVLTVAAPGVLSNDTDPELDPLTTQLYQGPTNGTLVLNANGGFVYTPNANFFGNDKFIYEAIDATGAKDTASVFLIVTPVNDPPVANGGTYTTQEDQVLSISAPGLLFNDTDPENDPLTSTLLTPPVHGTAVVNANGSFTYTPAANFNGTDSIVYKISDGFGGTDQAVVRIIVLPVNDNPIGVNDAYSVAEDATLTVAVSGVLLNDSDPDGGTITVGSVTVQPTHGVLTQNANGGFVYVPTANYNGPDSYTYELTDGVGGTATAVVNITVTPTNDAPVALNDTYNLTEDVPYTAAQPGVLFNDTDPDGNTLTASVTVGPTKGSIVLAANGGFTYTPNANFFGKDSITYTVNDGNGGTSTAKAFFIVDPINDVPVAVADNYTTGEDVILVVPVSGVLSNDTDPENDLLTVTNVTTLPVNGTLVYNADGSFNYTPNLDFTGTDSFIYTISDGNGGTASATATITVTAVNEDPIALNDDFNVPSNATFTIAAPGVMINDVEPDGEPLTVTPIVGLVGSQGGTLTINADGSLSYIPAVTVSYDEVFTYTVNDNSGKTATATATFHVGHVNAVPDANDDVYTINEDTQLNKSAALGVLSNDTDADDIAPANNLTAVLVSGPSHGTLTLNPDGSFIYIPAANYTGADVFTYNATDANGANELATVNITVDPVNDSPVAVDNSATGTEDNPVTINILTNDSDVDGALDLNTVDLDTLTAGIQTTFTVAGQGTYTVSFGIVTFTPVANFKGIATPIRYTVKDDHGARSNAAVIAITLTNTDDAPVAVADVYTVAEDAFLIVNVATGVLSNDNDPDGDPFTAVLVSNVSNGTLTLNANGSFDYHPGPSFNGTDIFTYKACDALNTCSVPVQVTITVTPQNDVPIANNDAITIVEDTPTNPATTTVAGNDSDPDGDLLTYTVVNVPMTGSVVMNPDGSYTYTPSANYNGTDQFSYKACDGSGACDTAFVNITITPVNDIPVAVADAYTTDEDVTLNISAAGVLGNDVDGDGSLAATIVTTSNGALTLNSNGSFTYVPVPNFHGTDSFVYKACDAEGACSNATVTITVNSINDKPVASDDAFSTSEDLTFTATYASAALSNDVDVDGDPLTIRAIGSFTKGTFTDNGNGTFSYTPPVNYSGIDTVQYEVCDGLGLCDTAFIKITILPANDAPTVVNEAYTTNEDVQLNVNAPGLLTNDSDSDGDPLLASLFTAPKHGTATISSQGALVYIPAADYNGLDSVIYEVCDGSLACTKGKVIITVLPVNDPPAVVADVYTVNEDAVLNIAAPGILTNDVDKDGDPFTISLVTTTTHGVLVFNANGSFKYTPDANYNGTDEFTYKGCDNAPLCATTTVTITVVPQNDAPSVNADSYVINEDQVLSRTAGNGVLLNDSDIDGTVTPSVTIQPAHGTVTMQPDGSFIYTPDANYFGFDQFVYKGCDASNLCDTGLVRITINPLNDAPVVTNDLYTTVEETALTISAPGVLVNDVDPDADIMTATITVNAKHGTVTLSPNGGFVYRPDFNFSGTDTAFYRVSDGFGGLATGMIRIVVTPINDIPVGVADAYTTDEDVTLTIADPGVLANDTDSDGDTLTVGSIISSTTNGSLSVNPKGGFTYIPNPNYTGTDLFTYQLNDGHGGAVNVVATIVVAPKNDKPVARNDVYTVTEDVALTRNDPGVLFNDTDPDGDVLTVVVTVNPLHGTVTLNPTGGFTYTPTAGYNGPDSFKYKASDGKGGDSTATVNLNIRPVNDPPIAVTDNYTVAEDGVLSIPARGVMDNDSDPDGNPIFVNPATTGPLHGTINLLADGSFTYTPNPDFFGLDTYVYTLRDNQGATVTGTVKITVTPVPDAPIARDDQYTVVNSGNFDITAPGVLSNDFDGDGDPLTVTTQTAVVGSNGGKLTLNADGSLHYEPLVGGTYTETFPYTISDGTGRTASANIVFNVSPNPNTPPTAVNDSYTTAEDVTLVIPAKGILTNDTDPDDALGTNNLSAVLVSGTSNGTLTLNADGSFTYSPNQGYTGPDSFTYKAADANGAVSQATVNITVTPVNDAPTANDDLASTNEDVSVTFSVIGNDTDDGTIDGSTVDLDPSTPGEDKTFTVAGEGTYTVNTSGQVTFAPVANFFGTTTVVHYTVKDNGGLVSNQAAITITVISLSDSPIATKDSYTVAEDAFLNVPSSNGVLINDSDPDNDPILAVINTTNNGSVTLNPDGSFSYHPDADFSGTDNFTYQTCDQGGLCSAPATVTIIVTPVNDAPTAVNDVLTVNQDTPGSDNASTNDKDVDGDPLTFSVSINPLHGAVIMQPNGSYTYTPATGYVGSDQITYKVCDNKGACSNAVISITVNAVNAAPLAAADNYTVNEDAVLTRTDVNGVLINDIDPDGGAIPAYIQTNPAHGTVVLRTDGSFTYTPTANYFGNDSFIYRICDPMNACDTAIVRLVVLPVNDLPVARDDAYATTEETVLTVNPTGVLGNDTDIDGDVLTASVVTTTKHGTTTLNTNGSFTYTPNVDFFGTDTLFYQLNDGNGGADTAFAVITVTSVNDAPVAGNDSYTTNEDVTLVVPANGVLANDSDPDLDAISITGIVSPALHGTVTLNTDGSFTYVPNANYSGLDSCTYRIIDGKGGADTATVLITVVPMNDPPVARNDAYDVQEDTPLSVPAKGVLFNDSDPENDPLTSSVLVGPTKGTVVLNADGSFLYTPNSGYSGPDSFTYTITDGTGSSSATVTLTVKPLNDAPIATDDAYTTAEETPMIISAPGILGNDTDADLDALTVLTVITAPAHGSLVSNANGSFAYTPSLNFFGLDTCIYIVSDGKGGTDTGTVVITVTPVNDPPLATNDEFNVTSNTPLTVGVPGVLFNDREFDGETLTVTVISNQTGPQGGTLTLNADGSLTYTPTSTLIYDESFTYTVSDQSGNSATAVATFHVGKTNTKPVAADDFYSGTEDTPLFIAAPGVLLNDSDPDDGAGVNSLGAVLLTQVPAHGTVTLFPDGSFNYIPDHNFFGADQFAYSADDANGARDTAVVRLTIVAVNDAPVAVDNSVSTNEDTPVNITITDNDSDVDGTLNKGTVDLDPNTSGEDKILTVTGEGSYSVSPTAVVTFVPEPNYHGTPTPIHYTIKDNSGALSNVATIGIIVLDVNDAPVAQPENYTVAEDGFLNVIPSAGVLINDSDIENDPIASVLVTTSPKGTLSLQNDGSFTYHPNLNFNGTDSFEYKACDLGGACSAPVTVIINVTPVNDAPVAVDDNVAVTENVPKSANVSINDSDPDGDPLTFVDLTLPTNGTLSFQSTGVFTYTPNTNFKGTDQFSYKACDGTGLCATAVVNLTVTALNQLPIARTESFTIIEDQILTKSATTGVLINDNDPDGTVLLATVVTAPTNGGLTLNTDGSFTYTPNANYFGNDSFIYNACDAQSGCDTAIVYINITSVNDTPVAVMDVYTTPEETPLTVSGFGVISNDSDADGDPLTATVVTGPKHGTITLNLNGSFVYTPDNDFGGLDSIIYKVSDNQGASATSVIRITVIATNDAPIAADDSYSTNEDTPLSIAATGVLGNDQDPDGDVLSVTGITKAALNGVAVINANGSFTYTPNLNFSGTDSFSYRVADSKGGADTAVVTIVVNAVNDAPVARDDHYDIIEDQTFILPASGVLFNDSDPEGDALTVSLITGVSHGTLTLNSNGGFTYVPVADYNGPDSFTYLCTDSKGASTSAVVTINVRGLNDVPVAVNDTYAVAEDATLNVPASGILNNDSDPEGNTLSVGPIVIDPQHGVLVQNTDGSFTYVPYPNYNGPDSYTYTLLDGLGGSATATVNITVTPVADAPIARDDYFNVETGLTLVLGAPGVMFNDMDHDGDVIAVIPQTNIVGSKGGTLTLLADGSITYVPSGTTPYDETFPYSITDGSSNANAVIHIAYGKVNTPPIAVNDAYTTVEETSVSILPNAVLLNDNDPDDAPGQNNLAAILITPPSNGSLLINTDGSFTYIPQHNFSGSDFFIYKAQDANGAFGTATVTITVTPVNDKPIARDDAATTNEDTPVLFSITNNDTDPDGTIDPTSVDLDPTTPAVDKTKAVSGEGTYSVSTAGVINFIPDANFNGPTTPIFYTVRDNTGALSNVAAINVFVSPVNDTPLAFDDSYTVAEDNFLITTDVNGVLANDSDPDNESIVSILNTTTNGTLVLNGDGSFNYRPNPNFTGTDVFTYQDCDLGNDCSVPARVTIIVTPVNDGPIAVNDILGTNENTPGTGDVSLNDSDVDNDPLTFTVIIPPAHGTASMFSNGTYTYTPTTGYKGPDQFTYRVCDNGGLCATAIVDITVSAINAPPVALPDVYTMNEDQIISRGATNGVMFNDSDPDGAITATLVSTASNGTLTFNSDGSFVYKPAPNFFGTDSFIYNACDIKSACDTALVTINVNPVNDKPDAMDDRFTTNEDVPVTYNGMTDIVNTNDSDVDGDALTLQFIGTPKHGTNVNNGNGTFTYIPTPNYSGADSIQYRVCDGGGLCDSAYVQFTVVPVNDLPIANDDNYTTAQNTALAKTGIEGVLKNDVDPDGILSSTLLVSTQHGTLTLNPNGSFVYRPANNFIGTDSFVYAACDNNGACDNATVTITVYAVNQRPLAIDDYTSTYTNTPVSGNVLNNDSDPEGGTLNATLVNGPGHGTVTLNSDGTFTYTPDGVFIGGDKFMYMACDNGTPAVCDSATVYIQVVKSPPSSTDPPPMAVRDTFTVAMDESLIIAKPGVITNDVYHDKNVLVASVTVGVTKGSLYFYPNGSFVYVPSSGFVGQDSFTYKICDTLGLCDDAVVLINVDGSNRRPQPKDDFYTVFEDDSLTVLPAKGFLVNDEEPDGDSTRFTIKTYPLHGTLVLTDLLGGFKYYPDANYNGPDYFNYEVCDFKSPAMCNTATVTINVIPVNDGPVAIRDQYDVVKNVPRVIYAPGVLLNDYDIDGDQLSSYPLSFPMHGSLTLKPDGSFSYIPDQDFIGLDSILYKACDPSGLCAQAYLVLNVIHGTPNYPPIAVNDTIIVPEDGSHTFTKLWMLSNDIEPDGDPLIFSMLSNTVHGMLVNQGNNTYTYIPDANYYGPDSLTYQICDPFGQCDTAIVYINVVPVNDKPIANDDIYVTDEDTELNVPSPSVLANDSDIDGDALIATVIGTPIHGSMVINADSSLKYIPDPGFFGEDYCYYKACDAGGLCDTALVRITVREVLRNAKPIVTDDNYFTPVNTTLNIPAAGVLANDYDPEGDPLVASVVTTPLNGTLQSFSTNGAFVYIPNANFLGIDTYTYKACDNGIPSLCDTKTVTINVIGDPKIGVAKGASAPALQPDGSYLVTFSFVVRNYGNVPLTNVGLSDDLNSTFPAPATFTIVAPPVASGGVVANNAYNGSSDVELLSGSNNLAVGQMASLSFTVKVNAIGSNGNFNNVAFGSGFGAGMTVTDASENGSDPDPDRDNDPGNNSIPTPINFNDRVSIGLAKAALQPVHEPNGSYTITYKMVVKNFGNKPLSNVNVSDDLAETFTETSNFFVQGNVISSGNLAVNPNFDGVAAKNLYGPGVVLGVGQTDTLTFVVNAMPTMGVHEYLNRATATGSFAGYVVTDESVNGFDSDANGNGLPEDVSPTPVTLKLMDIFVPGGFSPDGDGNNEALVIENVNGRTIFIELYNRWGNVVFRSDDYKNDWKGTCTVGVTFGETLPAGTYYYLMKVDGVDPTVGFITINR